MKSLDATSDDSMTVEQKLEALLPKMYAHALVITKSKEIADELVQDTCVRVLSRSDQWQREKGRFDGWVGAIMQSIWSNGRRHARHRSYHETELPEPSDLPDQRAGNAEDDVGWRLFLAELRQACTTLSDEDFMLLIKIHQYGYSYRDLADEAGCPIGTMLSRVSRARMALRKTARQAAVEPPTQRVSVVSMGEGEHHYAF